MPAKNTAHKRIPRKPGRPIGSITRFPGSCVFAASQNVTAAHFHRVLTGERSSKRLLSAYAQWLSEKGIPWPKDAKVSPAA